MVYLDILFIVWLDILFIYSFVYLLELKKYFTILILINVLKKKWKKHILNKII